MDIPEDARRRLAEDKVVWLTTVTDSGAPAPNPVWFVPDGDDIVVFTQPSSLKVHNIEQRPVVTVHFNSDRDGDDIVIVTGRATITPSVKPSTSRTYLEKYEADIVGALATTVEAIDATYDTHLRITPVKIRTAPT